MELRKVLFLGGSIGYPSVQIRCVDLARRLGCDFQLGAHTAQEIPDKYSIFVCVKPRLRQTELSALARRGCVVWDIIDDLPPAANVAVYLASSSLAQNLFSKYGRVELIPHYHCNFEGTINPPGLRRPVWLGSRHWLPLIQGFPHETIFVENLRREDIVQVFRQTGIGLNLRGLRNLLRFANHTADRRKQLNFTRKMFDKHIALNTGIKLINCLGFGIPSISSDEPAYHEFGENCTLFSNLRDCAKWVRALQHDDDLYSDLRRQCLRQGKKFHIDAIANKYRTLFASL